ncbi:MAG: hypothetical protein KDC38_10035, partial [Planctomycetes bacterium]|nr:hypothetical protein [Planctomycetota bacterium]
MRYRLFELRPWLSLALLAVVSLAVAQDIEVAGVPNGTARFSTDGTATTVEVSDGAVIDYQRFGVGE